ncbi:hypothetical protein HDU82_000867, partial [Entophlyctis luteolus]
MASKIYGLLPGRRAARVTAALAGVGLGLWATDRTAFSSAGERSLRTLGAGLQIAYLYKFDFGPGTYERVHKRAADLILETCKRNSGLYIKFAQQIATVSNILPPQWSAFRTLYDQAPGVPYDAVVRVFAEEFGGLHPDEVFDEFESQPRASASIAQVHRARLKGSNEYVAVKIQKPDVAVQVDADLFSFKVVMYLLQELFDLKLTWTLPTINKHLLEELDFVNEARNSELAMTNLMAEPSFKGVVHIPKIYWNLTTKRIMTAEWIDGMNFGDVEKVRQIWGNSKVEGMMTTLVDVFSDQLFRTGFLAADPHPGNILIRPCPTDKTKPQIVLLDHGLYVKCSPEFTADYRNMWVGLFSHDVEMVETIAKKWGIGDVQLFAIGTLQKPWSKKAGLNGPVNLSRDVLHMDDVKRDANGKLTPEQSAAMQEKMKERVKKYLENTDVIPRELIFVGRSLNIIRSNNKIYGSP